MYLYTFTVMGVGNFPLDMLRYDACFPLHQRDVANIFNPGEPDRMRQVTLRTAYRTKKGVKAYTEERWASFGWRVISSMEPYKV